MTVDISIRDQFICAALNGLLSNREYGAELKRIFDPEGRVANQGTPDETPLHYVARLAIAAADAVLDERLNNPIGTPDADTKAKT